VAREVIEHCMRRWHRAEWGEPAAVHFVAGVRSQVSRHPRRREAEEREFYGGRAPEECSTRAQPIGTDWQKPFLETAPWLIAIFVQRWGRAEDGGR